MNDSGYLSTSRNHITFWKWSGGATAFVILITTCVVWRSRALAESESGSANPIPIILSGLKQVKERFIPRRKTLDSLLANDDPASVTSGVFVSPV